MILFTVSHELTHFMRDFAPEQFDKYAAYLFENYAKHGGSVRQAVYEEMNKHQKLTYDVAYEEVVARLSEAFLRDVHLTEKSRELYNTDKGLWQSIKTGLEKIVDRIEKYFAQLSPDSRLGKIGAVMARENKDILDRFVAGIREAADNAAYTENTTDEGGVRMMSRGDSTAFNENAVSTAIWESLDHADNGNDNLIRVSKMPMYIQSLLGIDGDFYIQRNHTYENTVSESRAKEENRFDDDAHYHDYGEDKMTRALLSIEHPIMTIATRTNDRNPTVIMILDEYGNNGVPLYGVLSFYSNKLINGRNDIKPHVVLTIAEREWFAKDGRTGYDEIIRNAINEKRVIDFDQNKRADLTEVAKATSLGSITASSLNKSLSQFKKEINSFKDKNKIYYQSRDADNTDADYLSAVNRGDMETAQRMVDEAAEQAFADSKIRDEDGKLIKVYHGTYADFNVFDKAMGRSSADIQGMFFSPWDIDAGGYGPNVRAFYLNITNPADERTGYKALNAHKRENYVGIKAREDLEKAGYDGVNNSDEEYIAFTSEQIKSADPVTYDDNGKVIPLSQRFNSEEKDIRYDDREDDLIDDEIFYSEYTDIGDVIKRQYTTHSEAIGEVLKNTADIDIATGKVITAKQGVIS